MLASPKKQQKFVVINDTSVKMKLDDKTYIKNTNYNNTIGKMEGSGGGINHKTPCVITATIANNNNNNNNNTLVSNKNFNSKEIYAGASEIYGNNLEKNKQQQQKHLQSISNGSSGSGSSGKNNSTIIKKLLKKLLNISQKKDIDPKIYEFIKLIDHHKEFFKKSPEIDKFVLALAYYYLKKAYSEEYLTNEMFFYALYLAWETEEDSTLGLESIIHYVIGSYPSSKNKDKNQRKQEILEWRLRLRHFHAGKDILWKALDYKTTLDYPILLKTMKTFPNHDILKRDRSQSIKFF